MTLFKAFIYLTTSQPTSFQNVNVCELDDSHLSLSKKIELSIGCSYVNGKEVFSDRELRKFYDASFSERKK